MTGEPKTSGTGPSVYQRVLGTRFELLTPELRGYFSSPDAGTYGRGDGVFEVAGARRRWLAPVFALFAPARILFPDYAEDIPFTVVNRIVADTLRAERTFRFRAHERVMLDEMRVIGGRLHDFLGTTGQLEVALDLSVDDGRLIMTSAGAWLHLGRRRIRLPALLSASVLLTEQWERDHQRVSVALRHPLLGEIFTYRGTFTYRYESD